MIPSSSSSTHPVTADDPSLGLAATSDKGKFLGLDETSQNLGSNKSLMGGASTSPVVPPQGQSSTSKSASGNGQVPASSPSQPDAAAAAAADGDKDKGSLSTTIAGTVKDTETRRKANISSETTTSEKQKASSSNPSKQKSTRSPSFLTKLLRKLVPCLGPSSAHVADLEDTGSDRMSSTMEKQVSKDAEKEKPREPSVPSTSQTTPTTITIPPAIQDPEVILPPTPTKLLPQAETEGVTSGAVQPPGSRGDEGLPSHPRTETRDSGEESDGTSYTEDEDVDEHLDDPEDDEERLILNGGAGIPIIVGY